jgi:lipopolysaccharide export system permease protein
VSVLDRYVLGRFLRMLPLCIAAAAALFLLVDFFQRIGELTKHGAGVWNALAYFSFKLPRVITEVYPAASLLAVLIGLGALAEGRELLACRSCGVSTLRVLAPLAACAALLSLVVLAWNEVVVPPTASRARMIQDVGIEKRLERGVFNASSLWFQSEQGFVNINYFDATRNELHGITLHQMDESFRLVRIVEARKAVWRQDHWDVLDTTVTMFEGGADALGQNHGTVLALDVNPDELRRKRRRAYEFSYRDLSKQILGLERKGLDATEYMVDCDYKLAAPFAGLVAVILGLPLAARGGRRSGGGVLRNVGLGLAVSFVYWSATALAVAAGHAGTLPPLLAAWAANILFGIGGTLLYVVRDV